MINKGKANKTETALKVCVFLGLFIFACIYCRAKRTFMTDESLSFALSNDPVTGWVSYANPGWYTHDTFRTWAATVPFNWSRVFLNQKYDVHPPLYYLILHAVCSVFAGHLSIWFGLVINLLAYMGCCQLVYRIAAHFTSRPLFALLAVLLYGLNPSTLYGLQMIRMYQLTSLFVLWFAWAGIRFVESEKCGWKEVLPLILSVICGGLTHYFFYFIMLSLCLAFAVCLLCSRRFGRLFLAALAVGGASALNLFVLFPATREHLFSSASNGAHGSHVLTALQDSLIHLSAMEEFLRLGWCSKPLFVLMLLLFPAGLLAGWLRHKPSLVLTSLMGIAWIINFTIVAGSSTFMENRYLIPSDAVGMVSLAVTVLLLLEEAFKRPGVWVACAAAALFTVFQLDMTGLQYLETKTPWNYAGEHSTWPLLIVTDRPDYDINTSFLEIWKYENVGLLNPSVLIDPPETISGPNFVLYADRRYQEEEIKAFLSEDFLQGRRFSLQPVGSMTTYFAIYEITAEETP